MGILPSLIPFSSRNVPDPTNDYWYYPRGATENTDAGIPVDEATALKYLTAFACISLVGGDVARLPLNLYRRRKDSGKDQITDHQLYDLLHNAPNSETTFFNWRESLMSHLMLWGNHYSFCERNKAGEVLSLWQIPAPGGVKVRRAGNELVYEYSVDGEPRIRRRDQIFHIPGFGFNGLVGMSMIGLAREAIGMGLAAEKFGSRFFGAGTHPGGLISMPAEVEFDPENQQKYIDLIKSQSAGIGKSHELMVLFNGEKYQPFTMPLNDAQFLESRDHQKIEICGMYHVPPHKIAIHGQNSNYNNLEQENSSYVDSCLMQWLVRIEAAINLQLLSERERRSGMFFEFLVAGLLRGDSQARAEYYTKMFRVAGITPNQIASKENMNPIGPDGDRHFVELNMVPLDQAGKMDVPLPGDKPKPAEAPKEGDEIKSLRAFFSDDKFAREQRSIMARDRIAKRYHPLILDAATAIVNRETKAIKNRVAGRSADTEGLSGFLADFYDKFPEYIEMKMAPVLRSYMQAIIDESAAEIGSNDDPKLDTEIREYIDGYSARHTKSSLGQMLAILEGENLADIDKRADEWAEKRPEKIVRNEIVRASGAAFSWVVFGAGMAMFLRNRGPKTCPYCQSMNGVRVTPSQPLVSVGGKIDAGDGSEPMPVYETKFHTPLHQGCDCFCVAGW